MFANPNLKALFYCDKLSIYTPTDKIYRSGGEGNLTL